MLTYTQGIDPASLPAMGWDDWIPLDAEPVATDDIGIIAYLLDADLDTLWPFLGIGNAPELTDAWYAKHGIEGSRRAAGRLDEFLSLARQEPSVLKADGALHTLMELTFKCIAGTNAWKVACESARPDPYFLGVRYFDQSRGCHQLTFHLAFGPPPHHEDTLKETIASALQVDLLLHPEWHQLYPE